MRMSSDPVGGVSLERLAAVGLLAILAGCDAGPERPRRAPAAAAFADRAAGANDWPILLQHCLKSPDCDPIRDLGDGAGEASGARRAVVYRARTSDGGDSAEISAFGWGGDGGDGGRPLSPEETPASLRFPTESRSWLTVRLSPGPTGLEPVSALLQSAHVRLADAVDGDAPDRAERVRKAAAATAAYHGGRGARIRLSRAGAALAEGFARGEASATLLTRDGSEALAFEPWRFRVVAPVTPALLEALVDGAPLDFEIRDGQDRLVLRDRVLTGGFSEAVAAAASALADPRIAEPVSKRCDGWPAAASPAADLCAAFSPADQAATSGD
jgi:hypothetical protein